MPLLERKLIRIDRAKWIRGRDVLSVPSEGSDHPHAVGSMLYRPEDGKMCCIGQACLQLGMTVEQLSRQGMVSDIIADGEHTGEIPAYFTQESDEVEDYDSQDEPIEYIEVSRLGTAYEINDHNATTDAEKEAALVPLFNAMNLDIEFYN